jgi:hypothetical protein
MNIHQRIVLQGFSNVRSKGSAVPEAKAQNIHLTKAKLSPKCYLRDMWCNYEIVAAPPNRGLNEEK